MKTTTHEQLLNEIVGNAGTLEREQFENELKADILASRLKELRKKKHITQSQLAEKLGMDKTQISKIENGKFNLTLQTVNRFANALNARINFQVMEL